MSYQQLIIVGNVGRDPELRYVGSGVAVTDISVAVMKKWTDAQGNKQETTTWYKVVCWRKTAEIVAQYVRKGNRSWCPLLKLKWNPTKPVMVRTACRSK